jgi:nicotinic acid phosphoribosyltransferase
LLEKYIVEENTMENYFDFGVKTASRINRLLDLEGLKKIPDSYAEFMKLDHWLRKLIGGNLPLVLSDNYEHFMACLPGKRYAGQHVIIRKQIGGFTVSCGFWKWLEFLSHQITKEEVELAADFFSGRHNGFPRQFNKDYWLHVVDDFDGYLPVKISYVGEGVTFTGVPFPVAEIYGETPAVWLNEPMYIQIGNLSHIATVAAQFSEILGDPWRFIEVMFRALHNKEECDDVLLAMLIGGGIISTSNDLGAFINGSPFKCSGTTGHCYYQQYNTLKEALTALLQSPLGKYSTVLLDVYKHEHGFQELQQLIDEGLTPPFAERPDSGDTLKIGMHDLTALQDQGKIINVVFEDGYKPSDVMKAEVTRKQYGLSKDRALYGAGSAFIGPRRALETAYKACCFHDGNVAKPENIVETMKICLDDTMKQSIPGFVNWFYNDETGVYMLGCDTEEPPHGSRGDKQILYDGITNPGKPYFNPDYNPMNLATCPAIIKGIERTNDTRKKLGPDFTRQVGENKTGVSMSKSLREKRKAIYKRALQIVGQSENGKK